jgi:hypothetical protein
MFYNNLWFNRIYRGLASLLFLFALTACSSIGGVVTQQNKEQSFAGPGTLFEASEFIDLNLCNTILSLKTFFILIYMVSVWIRLLP